MNKGERLSRVPQHPVEMILHYAADFLSEY